MSRGRVYLWAPDPTEPLGGTASVGVVPLPNLLPTLSRSSRLRGRHVVVSNGGWVNEAGPAGVPFPTKLADAAPCDGDDFLFEQGRGGGRIDKVEVAEADFRWRYIQAARFGEVNAYFHVDRMASYIEGLLTSLGAPRLPPVSVAVNAHHAATTIDGTGRRDGVRGRRQWLPFQGGHYRVSARTREVPELRPVSPLGEIHLGPGWQLLEQGALVRCSGGRYRANASHNPGIIYHEYGHHLTRHTADLSANDAREIDRQDNRKTALDEGMCDFWTAAMLDSPHIWAFHHRHDREVTHARSLVSRKTMADFDPSPRADPHANGTIWAATLWDLRTALQRLTPDGARVTDRLVLASLLALGRVGSDDPDQRARHIKRRRSDYGVAARALLDADEVLEGGRHHEHIAAALALRGIAIGEPAARDRPATGQPSIGALASLREG
jgi:hypothetical protein